MSTVLHWCTNAFFASLPPGLNTVPPYSVAPLDLKNSASFIVRADNGMPSKVINIFDSDGNKAFTLERLTAYSQRWCLYEEPIHKAVAELNIGLIKRDIHAPELGTTKLHVNSGLLGPLHRHYFDKQGGLYSWNRRSQNLERIDNPGGGHEEHRTVVASVHKLRANKFDWEITINVNEVDVVTTLASAFITMKTQWIIPQVPITGTRSARAVVENPCALEPIVDSGGTSDSTQEPQFTGNDLQHLMVFEPRPVSDKPREFFNPPDFMRPT